MSLLGQDTAWEPVSDDECLSEGADCAAGDAEWTATRFDLSDLNPGSLAHTGRRHNRGALEPESMAEHPSAESVESGDDYYHVRYRDPDEFDEIRTPDWAENPAESVVEGAEVRTGDDEGDDDWTVQSVLIPMDAVDDGDEAAQRAQQVVEKIA